MLLAAMRRNLLGWADHSPPVPFEWEQYLATRRQRDAMFILTVRWDVRAIWSVLTPTARFYVLCLLLAAVATTYFLGQSIFRMRRLLNGVTSIDAAIAGRCATKVKGRIENLRQLHLLLFFLFGMIFANEMFALVRAIEHSSMSLSAARIDICEPITALAFFVFGVLLFLHILQWIVATLLQSFLATLTGRAVVLD